MLCDDASEILDWDDTDDVPEGFKVVDLLVLSSLSGFGSVDLSRLPVGPVECLESYVVVAISCMKVDIFSN